MSVTLKCFKEKNKLRIKIISPGYISSANCMFPKNIRVEGQEYTVPIADVMMADTRGKFFYRIKKDHITIVDNVNKFDNLVVYGDDVTECAICMETYDDYMIFVPCGHYCCCHDCAKQLKNCCMCRAPIKQLITKEQLQ
jgi:hypothetical protein